jgi:hypothetical protein
VWASRKDFYLACVWLCRAGCAHAAWLWVCSADMCSAHNCNAGTCLRLMARERDWDARGNGLKNGWKSRWVGGEVKGGPIFNFILSYCWDVNVTEGTEHKTPHKHALTLTSEDTREWVEDEDSHDPLGAARPRGRGGSRPPRPSECWLRGGRERKRKRERMRAE